MTFDAILDGAMTPNRICVVIDVGAICYIPRKVTFMSPAEKKYVKSLKCLSKTMCQFRYFNKSLKYQSEMALLT
jgi:hypothetical protein